MDADDDVIGDDSGDDDVSDMEEDTEQRTADVSFFNTDE